MGRKSKVVLEAKTIGEFRMPGGRYQCPMCGKECRTSATLRRHLRDGHWLRMRSGYGLTEVGDRIPVDFLDDLPIPRSRAFRTEATLHEELSGGMPVLRSRRAGRLVYHMLR